MSDISGDTNTQTQGHQIWIMVSHESYRANCAAYTMWYQTIHEDKRIQCEQRLLQVYTRTKRSLCLIVTNALYRGTLDDTRNIRQPAGGEANEATGATCLTTANF